ncbi:MAG: hypothetical protein Q9218_004578 [Villophora microphyllina]
MLYKALVLLLVSNPFPTQGSPARSLLAPADTSPGPINTTLVLDGRPLITRGEEDDTCDAVDKCTNVGQKLWDALQTKLLDSKAQDETKYDGTLAADYQDVRKKDLTPPVHFQQLFKDLNLDYEKHFAMHTVKSNIDVHDAFENMFNTNQGTLIGYWNYKEYDTKKTMPFSEVIFQCYKKECDEESELKKFQFAGIYNVANNKFGELQEDLYNSNNVQKITNRFVKWTFDANKDAFLALLGTPLLNFVLRMLTDHSVAFGRIIPTEVWTNIRTKTVYVKVGEFKG